jgi:hypothetical protein
MGRHGAHAGHRLHALLWHALLLHALHDAGLHPHAGHGAARRVAVMQAGLALHGPGHRHSGLARRDPHHGHGRGALHLHCDSSAA